MRSSPHVLQLLQHASPLTTHGGAAAAGMLRRLAPADLTGLLASQIRGYAAEASSASDLQGAAASSSDITAAATSSVADAADSASVAPSTASAATARSKFKQWENRAQNKADVLKQAGLWVPADVFKSLSRQEQHDIAQRQQQYRMQLQLHQPLRSLGMSAMVLNPHQLQVVVALATDAAGDGSSSSSSSSSLKEPGGQAAAADISAEQAQASSSSSSSSSSTAPQQQQQGRRHQQQRKQRQQPQQQQQQVAEAPSSVNPLEFEFVTQPRLDKRSCEKEPSEQSLVINLNSQMRMAYGRDDFAHVVSLFDQFLEKGIAAAEAAAADKLQQQQPGQQQQQLVLPPEYRPDHSALTLYCRSLVGLADAEEKRARQTNFEDRFNPQDEQQQQCSVARAEQAVALWGRPLVANLGFPAYYALLAAYRLAGKHDKAVEAFQALRAANNPEALSRHYRLYVTACSAAVRARNYQAANELARMFSTRQVAFKEADYRTRIAKIYRALVRGAASHCKWEDAIYWLQELINNQSLVPVPPEAFLSVMMPAAAAGRLDVVRTMMGAVDQHLALQGAKPLVYHADELTAIIKAAGTAGDTALIADAWARLKRDVQQKPTTAAPSTLPSQQPAGSNSSVTTKQSQPSPAAFKAVVKAYVDCKDFGKALQLIADLEDVYGGTRAASVYGGLSFLPIDELKREEDIAAVFAQLKARKDAGQPVSTAMMNIVCRAIGRLGNTEVTGKVFESYGAWGLQPDADSYNAVMESCEQAKKVAAVEGLISYMASKGVEPNQHSWNLLLSTAAEAKDAVAAASVVERMLGSQVQLLRSTASKALKLAHEKQSESLLRLVRSANEQQGLGLQPQVFRGWWRRGGGSSSGGSNGSSGNSGRADTWQQGMPLQQQQDSKEQGKQQDSQGQGKQQHGSTQLGQMLDQQGGNDSDERRSHRAGLAAALGAAMLQ